MTLVRWDPVADMVQLREQVERMFLPSCETECEPTLRHWAPPVDVEETPQALIFHAELPGLKPEEIDIQVDGNQLTITGERKFTEEQKTDQFVRIERTYGAFTRTFTLNVPIDRQKIHANYHDGLLDVTLPKTEAAKPLQIPIACEKKAIKAK